MSNDYKTFFLWSSNAVTVWVYFMAGNALYWVHKMDFNFVAFVTTTDRNSYKAGNKHYFKFNGKKLFKCDFNWINFAQETHCKVNSFLSSATKTERDFKFLFSINGMKLLDDLNLDLSIFY